MTLVHASDDLTVDVSRQDDCVLVTLDGIVDLATAPELRATLLPLVACEQALVLDLEHVAFVDSTGLGVLVSAHRRAKSVGGRFMLANLSVNLREVLRVTHLDQVIVIEGSES